MCFTLSTDKKKIAAQKRRKVAWKTGYRYGDKGLIGRVKMKIYTLGKRAKTDAGSSQYAGTAMHGVYVWTKKPAPLFQVGDTLVKVRVKGFRHLSKRGDQATYDSVVPVELYHKKWISPNRFEWELAAKSK